MTEAEVQAYLKSKGLKCVADTTTRKASHVVSATFNKNGTITLVLNVRSKSELTGPTDKGNVTVVGGAPVMTDLKYGDKNIHFSVTGWVKAS